MGINVFHGVFRHARILDRSFHGGYLAAQVRHDNMCRVASLSVTRKACVYFCSSTLGMFFFLQYEYACAFRHDKPIPTFGKWS